MASGGDGKTKKSAYKKKQDQMTPEQRAHRAEKQRLYMKRARLKAAGLPLDAAALDVEPASLVDEKLEQEVAGSHGELVKACAALKKEMPGLDLRKDGTLSISSKNMRLLYERTYASMEDDDDSDDWEDVDEDDAWAPPMVVRKYLRAHFKKRPFDKIRMGLLKIVTKGGQLVWMDPNDEQMTFLKALEDTWYNGEYFAGIALKSRQIGSSTFWTGVNYCVQSTQSHLTSHVVMHINETAEGILDMFRLFHENEPPWVRPKVRKKSNPLVLHGNGVKRAKIKIESAERRERVSRSTTFQLNHLSEVPYWAEPEETFNAMLASMDFKWPLIHIEESTGKNINDVFYNRFHDAWAGKMDGFQAFFFPWFQHRAYRKELPSNLTEMAFRASLSDEDVAMWDKHKLSKEQVYWYVTRRSREVSSGKMTSDMFKREYPCTIEEAFMGATSNFFDPARNKVDLHRTRHDNRVRSLLEDLKVSVSGFADSTSWTVPVPYAKCRLETDIQNGCVSPKFLDDENGEWTVLERPRPMHRYIVSCDIRRGKLNQKGLQQSGDFDSIGIWRYTHEPDEPEAMVQVAWYHGRMPGGPIEVAEQAVAASTVYRDEASGGDRALLVMENNSHGLASVEEAQRLGANQYQRIMYGKDREVISRELGFTTTTGGESAQGSKNYLLMRFRREWVNDRIMIFSPQTAFEMGQFVNNDGKLEAMHPNHDDTVMEAALAVEGVKYAEGEIRPVLVKVGDFYREALDDEVWGLELPEEFDRVGLLERLGFRVEAARKQSMRKWL